MIHTKRGFECKSIQEKVNEKFFVSSLSISDVQKCTRILSRNDKEVSNNDGKITVFYLTWQNANKMRIRRLVLLLFHDACMTMLI